MSAGIRNPCASINQPARALALGTDSPAHAGQRNNHYASTVTHYARRMRELPVMLTVRELLAVALQERKAKPNAGRVDTMLNLKVPVGLRTKARPGSCSTPQR
jgi:hypothetical protein